MKKTIILSILIVCLGGILIYSGVNQKQDKKLQKIKVSEVAHSIFYAPQYVAIAKNYFKNEGLDIELILTPGADKVMASILSNDVKIGLAGPESTIYVYQNGEKDYAQTFAGLTKRDGSFIVGRTNNKNFKLTDLKGKNIIGGRKGGMPEMTFEYALRKAGIDPSKDLKINKNVAFPAMGGAFIGGTGDYVTLFEPTALQIEKQGYGHVLVSVGSLGGEMPYTSYFAKKSYINKHENTIQNFTNAIQKGLNFVNNNSPRKIAKAIYPFFPDTSMNDLIKIVKRYQDIDAWQKNTITSKKSFDHMQDVMILAGELKNKTSFNILVNNKFAKKASE